MKPCTVREPDLPFTWRVDYLVKQNGFKLFRTECPKILTLIRFDFADVRTRLAQHRSGFQPFSPGPE